MIVLLALLSFAALAWMPKLRESQIKANERAAATALQSMATAETSWRVGDYDHNGVNDYWTGDVAGLFCVRDAGGTKSFGSIPLPVAAADTYRLDDAGFGYKTAEVVYDAAGLRGRRPSDGYWFQVLDGDLGGAPYGQVTDASGVPCHHRSKFGFFALPADTRLAGRFVYVIDERGAVLWKGFDASTSRANPGERVRDFASGVPARPWRLQDSNPGYCAWGKVE